MGTTNYKIYTPYRYSKEITKEAFREYFKKDYSKEKLKNLKIIDLSSGTGNLLCIALEKLIKLSKKVFGEYKYYENWITAYDLDKKALDEYRENIENILKNNEDITHIAMAHCETSSGILNSLEAISELARKYKKSLILDATATFGGMEFDVAKYGVDFLIATPNECLEGIAGFAFVVARVELLMKRKEKAHSYSLDMYDQWEYIEKTNGLWRFTPPVQAVKAFSVALDKLEKEGGIKVREKRYNRNYNTLRNGMKKLGFDFLVPEESQSPFLLSFTLPKKIDYNFEKLYKELKEDGFIIDRDELIENHIFRIGVVGDIDSESIEKFLKNLKKIV